MTSLLLRAAPLALALLSPTALAGTLYVDADATGGVNDGSSWADAFEGIDGLQAALAVATSGDRIFVAEGTYRTSSGTARGTSFALIDGVELYGSFLGGEATPAERPPFGVAPSVLTADLAGDDESGGSNAENSFHVVRAGSTDASAVLDGFVLTGGNANGNNNNDKGAGILCINASPTVRNCRFVGNRCTFGGGAGYVNGGSPTFTDCAFEGNDGGSFGGAFDVATAGALVIERCVFEGNTAARAGALEIFATSGPVVANSLFHGNTATGGGGGGALWIGSGGDTQVRGCTIVGNAATVQEAGGVRVQGATPTLANSILWDNEGPGGTQDSANQITQTADVTWSIVEGGLAGTGNLSDDPRFRDAVGGDFGLALVSPAIDAGDVASVPTGSTLDLAGQPRTYDEPCVADTGAGGPPVVDLGAYEFQGTLGTTFCSPAVANSTGVAGLMKLTGSDVVADDDLTLVALQLPPQPNIGYFLMGTGSNTFTPPGSAGPICIAPGIQRFLPPVNHTDELPGGFTRAVGTSGPVSGAITPGSTWSFQAWHRDSAAGTSNLTDAVTVAFQ